MDCVNYFCTGGVSPFWDPDVEEDSFVVVYDLRSKSGVFSLENFSENFNGRYTYDLCGVES